VHTVTIDAGASTTSSGNKDYSWSTSGGNIVGAAADSSWIDADAATGYTVTLTDPNNGCDNSSTVTVPIDTSAPDAMVAAPDTLTCTNTSVTLDASATMSGNGHSYSWSNGDTGPTTSVSTAGNYTLTVTDSINGCPADTTVTVPIDTVRPAPIVADPDTLTCSDPDVTLDASASTTHSGTKGYAWSTGDSSATTSVSSPGNYTVTVTDPNSGCRADTTVAVQEAGMPSLTIDSVVDASCNGSCDGAAYISVSGGSAPYSYQWAPSGQNVEDATGLCAGPHEVTVTDDNGCVVKDSVTVSEPPPLQVATIADTTICLGGTATLSATASGGTPGYTYHWDNGLGTGQTQTVSPGTDTVYTVYATDANACTSATATMRVEYHPPLHVTVAPDDSICPGGSTQLTATGSGGIGSGYSYSWSNGASGDTIIVSPGSTQDYVVSLEDGCETPSATDTVTVRINELPDVQIEGNDLEGCRPVEARLINGTADSMTGTDCVWDFGDGEEGLSCDSILHSYDAPGCYDVGLTVTSPEGCVDSTTLVDYVCVHPYPTADFDHSPEGTTVMDPAIDFTNMSTGATDYWWDFGGLDTSTAEHPSYEFPSEGPGTYNVCLRAESAYGCRDRVCGEVTIGGEFTLYVPNAFTPDGDGKNDHFKPVVRGADPTDYHFYVYDRWGEMIFETHHPEGRWDGSVKGSQSASKTDVYVWRLETTNKYTGEQIIEQGHVTLIR